MIPKKIHYCWFGQKPIPEKDRTCIESWKKYCPDYEIIEWNEDNYDVTKNPYMYAAYQEKKWGFVTDYIRFDIIYREGGFYLDTDVELVQSLDSLASNVAYLGFENGQIVNSGHGFGAEPGNEVIKALRDLYDQLDFYTEEGKPNLTPSPFYITNYLDKLGLKRNNQEQMLDQLHIYPSDYFAPKSYATGKLQLTDKTISIHHYHASWQTPKLKRNRMIRRWIGHQNYNRLVRLKRWITRKRDE